MTGISEKFTELHNTVIQNNSLNSTMILKTRQSQVCYIRFFFWVEVYFYLKRLQNLTRINGRSCYLLWSAWSFLYTAKFSWNKAPKCLQILKYNIFIGRNCWGWLWEYDSDFIWEHLSFNYCKITSHRLMRLCRNVRRLKKSSFSYLGNFKFSRMLTFYSYSNTTYTE